MRCPFCAHQEDRVVDSRELAEGAQVRRRRECLACNRRFTTYERIEEMPALVVWGRHDNVVPAGYAFALSDALPGPVSFHRLDRCGSIPPTEQPEEVLRLITEFLKNY